MNPKSAIAKGKALEEHVAEQIRVRGIDQKAYRSHGSGNGNTEKGDIWTSMTILGQNAGIECKNHNTLHIPEWWKQTKKLEKLGREPILVFKIGGEPMDESKVVIYLDTFLELVARQNGEVTVRENNTQEDRDKKYAIQNALTALKKLSKFY